jgi:hypothetical protein
MVRQIILRIAHIEVLEDPFVPTAVVQIVIVIVVIMEAKVDCRVLADKNRREVPAAVQ